MARTLLYFCRGKLPPDESGGERWDDIDMGPVTQVPAKGDTVRLDGKLYGVTRVHYNAERFGVVDREPTLYAFVHLALSADDEERR